MGGMEKTITKLHEMLKNAESYINKSNLVLLSKRVRERLERVRQRTRPSLNTRLELTPKARSTKLQSPKHKRRVCASITIILGIQKAIAWFTRKS